MKDARQASCSINPFISQTRDAANKSHASCAARLVAASSFNAFDGRSETVAHLASFVLATPCDLAVFNQLDQAARGRIDPNLSMGRQYWYECPTSRKSLTLSLQGRIERSGGNLKLYLGLRGLAFEIPFEQDLLA